MSTFLQKVIETCSFEKKKFFSIGDYNLNALQYNENEKVTNFYNSVFQNGAIPIITKPTRVTVDTATIIDNVITTEIFDPDLRKGIIKNDLSDHFPIFFSINISKTKKQKEKMKIKKRVFNEKNISDFREQLSLLHWQHIDFNQNANKIYENFIQTFFDVYDANFPIKEITLNKKQVRSPWISRGLKKSSKTKQKLYINYLKNKSLETELRYKEYKYLFEKLRKKSKKSYYSNLLKKYANDSKRTWQVMKELSGKVKSKSISLPKSIKVNNTSIYEPKLIAAEFNKFFTNVGPNLAKKIPETQTSFENYLTRSENTLDSKLLSFDEFEKAFKTLKKNKASGYDDISSNIIIDTYEEIKDILYNVFKAFIEQGIFLIN